MTQKLFLAPLALALFACSNSKFQGSPPDSGKTPTPVPVPTVIAPNEGGEPGSTITPTPTTVPTTIPTTSPTAVPTVEPTEQSIEQKIRDMSQVDIIWVIDNSNSMAWAQSQLSTKFSQFSSKLANLDLSVRMGITTMNVCNEDSSLNAFCPQKKPERQDWPMEGNLIEVDDKFWTETESDVENLAQFIPSLGVKGSPFEHGLHATSSALVNAKDLGMLRLGSKKVAIVVSDEEDDALGFWSGDTFGNPTYALDSVWKNKFNYSVVNVTADKFVELPIVKANRLQVFGIVPLAAPSCKGKVKEVGTNYIAAANRTGGKAFDICSENWDGLLNELGSMVAEVSNTFVLTSVPLEGSIVASVNDNEIVYTYDLERNTVTVDRSLLSYGDTVRISWQTFNVTLRRE